LETRIALLENGQLCELFIERTTHISQVGNLYKGRVTKILQGLQSAFVDIGGIRDAFLYLNESETQRLAVETTAYEEDEDRILELPEFQLALPLVKEGDEILVQVVKDSIGSKGPRISRHISIPGRFLVFMPGIEHIGVSRKITDNQERERLRTLVKGHAQPGEGFIVRTAAIGEKDKDIINDIIYLRSLWIDLNTKYQHLSVPSLAWKDLGLLQKIMRDLFREEVTSFWVDHDKTYEKAINFIKKLHPEWVERIKHFTSDLPIFDAFAIEKEIDSARQDKIFLRCGGSIIINQTEALVSIDVNTGKFMGNNKLEETVFLTNMEAIPEIVRQLRLRNLGGIIVIDFIDMSDISHRDSVMNRLQEELKRDRNHVRAIEISNFGLVEMTRKRTGPSLERMLTSSCPHCDGSGRRLSAETVILGIYREITRRGEKLRGTQLRLTIHRDLNKTLQTEIRDGVNAFIHNLDASIVWEERASGPVQEIALEVLHHR
jgi:ribonuclease G